MNKYNIRSKCIFCDSVLNKTFFEKDHACYSSHFMVDNDYTDFHNIPFNIYTCQECNTPQTKYLGDLNEIYNINHADSTGKTMTDLHNKTFELIMKYKNNIKNIIEIGSSKGILADIVLKNIDTTYNIIEPSYWGDRSNKNIIDDFYENVEDTLIDANTMIISHVFEHFYNPLDILNKIYSNKNIENFFLVFPDLEYYINNEVLHVLNTEHTYYVDNQFLISLLNNKGFELIEKYYHNNHSVIFYFKKKNVPNTNEKLVLYNNNFSLDKFYSSIFNKITYFNDIINSNDSKNVYLWPASIHTLYLFNFGLSDKITGFLDNSENKIGKKAYGINKEILSFTQIVNENSANSIIILNGGIFNDEVKNIIKNANNIKFIL